MICILVLPILPYSENKSIQSVRLQRKIHRVYPVRMFMNFDFNIMMVTPLLEFIYVEIVFAIYECNQVHPMFLN